MLLIKSIDFITVHCIYYKEDLLISNPMAATLFDEVAR